MATTQQTIFASGSAPSGASLLPSSTASNTFQNNINPPAPTSAFGGVQTTTPSSVATTSPNFQTISGGSQAVQPYNNSPVQTTVSGGLAFPSSYAAATNKATPLTGGQTYDPTTGTWVSAAAPSPSLANYTTSTSPAAGGGQVALNSNGQAVSYNPPASYSINTSGNIPSSALSSGTTAGDVMNQQQTYAGLVNALSQAEGYSPAYIAAQQGVWQGQANQANIAAELATGVGTTGLSQGQAQTMTGQEQALNTQQLTGQQIALSGQQLARTGQIASAQAQLQYSPTGMSGQQAITQYQQLQQQYPNAGIPPFNPNGDPIAQYNMAAQMVGQSAAYQAGFQNTYQTPGGGTGIYSKLNVASGALQSDGQGGYLLVPGAAAALGTANAGVVNTALGQMSGINAALNSTSQTLQSTEAFMQQYGINQTGVSILSQIQQAVQANLAPAGALAGWTSDLDALRSDYAQYLTARNGSIAGTNDTAASVIPDTISPAQLQVVVGQMTTDGQNTSNALSAQINQALTGLSTNSVQSTSGGTTGTPSVQQMNF